MKKCGKQICQQAHDAFQNALMPQCPEQMQDCIQSQTVRNCVAAVHAFKVALPAAQVQKVFLPHSGKRGVHLLPSPTTALGRNQFG